jgi:hypothetical protein
MSEVLRMISMDSTIDVVMICGEFIYSLGFYYTPSVR